jgi:hypothetical protein
MSHSKDYDRRVISVRESLERDREALLSGTCFIRRRESPGVWQDITTEEVGRLTFQIERLLSIPAGR